MLRSTDGRAGAGAVPTRCGGRLARASGVAWLLVLAVGACVVEGDDGSSRGPFAVRVTSFAPGPGAGFGAGALPEVVLGPPVGGGAVQGGTDVVSLGVGGAIVVELGGEGAVDGPGADLVVFENAFWVGGDPARPFAEPGIVAVSEDGTTFVEFPCGGEEGSFEGCAGRHPVFAAPGNGIDPCDPLAAGGDVFDLADVGVARARFVRIRDLGLGSAFPDTAGFDLDAVVALHACGE